MQRRNFIKKSCVACMGLAGVSLLLESCANSLPMMKTVAKGELLFIPFDKFVGDATLLVVRSKELENDILLVKKQDTYKALFLKCTHEGIALSATPKHLVCPAHGSIFDFDGKVLKEPALRPLKEFKTEIKDNNIIIHLT